MAIVSACAISIQVHLANVQDSSVQFEAGNVTQATTVRSPKFKADVAYISVMI